MPSVGVGTSSSADDAALNSRQGHGYKSWLGVERIPHKPGPCIQLEVPTPTAPRQFHCCMPFASFTEAS